MLGILTIGCLSVQWTMGGCVCWGVGVLGCVVLDEVGQDWEMEGRSGMGSRILPVCQLVLARVFVVPRV
jgi:hypothetical protein